MKKLIWFPLAGFLLVAGAAVAAAAPSVLERASALLAPAPATTTASEQADTGTTAQTEQADDAQAKTRPASMLTEVLEELVADNTITQAQADAVTNAVQAKANERRTEAQQRRDQMRETATKLREFLADGVITQDEIDQLPADSPLREIWNSVAQDGQVTLEQLRELRPHGGPGIGRGWGHGRFRAGPPDWAGGPPPWAAPDDGSDEESDN